MTNSIYQINDPRFGDLVSVDAPLRCISTGHIWTEGPVWVPSENAFLFSDIPNQKIHRWTQKDGVSVFRENSDFANGNTLDHKGRLITCQHGTRSVSRTEHDGKITTLVDQYQGKPLNSPNDVVVKSDGTIWFTDPTYGIKSNHEGYAAPQEQLGRYVFCFNPSDGALKVVATDFNQPNGLAFSNDETRLFIADSGQSDDPDFPAIVRVFAVDPTGQTHDDGIFATMTPGLPDGIHVDQDDNLWVSAADGVHCLAPDGKLMGKIRVPETVSNLTFGGSTGSDLVMTATTSVYMVRTKTRQMPPNHPPT